MLVSFGYHLVFASYVPYSSRKSCRHRVKIFILAMISPSITIKFITYSPSYVKK
jgi:hypothetical protein